jgi:hypothetical protein
MATTTTLDNAATASPPGPSTDEQTGLNDDIVIWAPDKFYFVSTNTFFSLLIDIIYDATTPNCDDGCTQNHCCKPLLTEWKLGAMGWDPQGQQTTIKTFVWGAAAKVIGSDLHCCIVHRIFCFWSICCQNLLDAIWMYWTRQDKAIHHAQNAMQLQPGTMMLPQKRLHSNGELSEKHVRNDGLCSNVCGGPDVLCNPSISKNCNLGRRCMSEILNLLDFS